MKKIGRCRPRDPDPRETGWLLTMVIVAVVLPTIGFLWFVNKAMNNERAVMRERTQAFYALQLSTAQQAVQERIRSLTEAAHPVFSQPSLHAEIRFRRVVEAGLADSLLVLQPDESVLYPLIAQHLDELDMTEADEKALSLLDRWHETGSADIDERLQILNEFGQTRCEQGRDYQGRLIYPGLQLALLEQLDRRSPSFQQVHSSLRQSLGDHRTSWPVAQRLFMARRLAVFGGEVKLPLEKALLLACQVADHPIQLGPSGILEASPGPANTWRLLTRDRRYLLLFGEGTITRLLEEAMAAHQQDGIVFTVSPRPRPEAETLRIDAMAPAWHISLDSHSLPLSSSAAQRRAYTTAVVCIVLALVGILGTYAVRRFLAQSQMTRLRNDFLSTVSHELKTPLTSTRMLVDTLVEGRVTDPDKTRSYLEVIGRENARLSHLVENFLTYSRLESGRMPFHFQPVLPEEIVNHALDALAQKLEAESVALTVDIEEHLPYVRADEATLTTALINLLDNAHKYTGQEKKIALKVFRQGDKVCFAVHDNGVGLTAAERQRVRERFYRVRDEGTSAVSGSGLGLSIVNNIVAAHGGTLLIESLPNQGSVFTIVVLSAGPR